MHLLRGECMLFLRCRLFCGGVMLLANAHYVLKGLLRSPVCSLNKLLKTNVTCGAACFSGACLYYTSG